MFSRILGRGCFAALLLTFAGCATTPKPATEAPSAASKPAAVKPAQPAAEKADELYLRLSEQGRGEPVLAALPADLRTLLDRRIERLTADERRALLDPAQPYAYQRPLLHLLAGGDVIGAYSALFSSAAAADELFEVRYESGRFEDLPPLVSELARRAARQVLVRRTPQVAPGFARKKEIIGEIAAAAEFLGDDPIYVAALSALERDYPDPQWAFMRAGALARSLQPEQARAALPSGAAVDAGLARSAEALIKAAEQAQAPATSVDEAIANARAQLLLDREGAAAEVLAPFAAQRERHLALAAVSLRTEAGTGPCPTVRIGLGNAALCRTAWQTFLTPERLGVIERAWASGAGRDVEGVDVWLGLSHVVPMMYGLQEDVNQALAHLQGLRDGAKAAVSVSPQYRGVELFAEILQTAFAANLKNQSPGMGEIPQAQRKQLFTKAAELNKALPSDSWAQGATLAAVAVTAPHEDGRKALSALNDVVRAEWRITHGSLLLWSLLASGDVQGFVADKGVLGRAAQVSAEGSYDRSRWVILWAEAEAHLEPSERSHGIVQELAQRLNSDQAPLDLRLRTAIDSAGLRARGGNFAAAAETLEALVKNTPRGAVSSRQEQELLVTATGYHAILRALHLVGQERAEHVAALAQLIDSVTRARAAPPALVQWLSAWQSELERSDRVTACNGVRACEQKAKSANALAAGSLSRELGVQMANLLRRGVLPIGGVELEFRYRGGRLVPEVNVDPAFLLVHMPPLDGPPTAVK